MVTLRWWNSKKKFQIKFILCLSNLIYSLWFLCQSAQHFSNKYVNILDILLYSCCLSCETSVIFVVTQHICMVVWWLLTLPQQLKCLLYKSAVRSECWRQVKWIDQSSLGTLCQHLHYLADTPHLKIPSSDPPHTKKKTLCASAEERVTTPPRLNI